MTVAQLIEELKKQPQEFPMVYDFDGRNQEVSAVQISKCFVGKENNQIEEVLIF